MGLCAVVLPDPCGSQHIEISSAEDTGCSQHTCEDIGSSSCDHWACPTFVSHVETVHSSSTNIKTKPFRVLDEECEMERLSSVSSLGDPVLHTSGEGQQSFGHGSFKGGPSIQNLPTSISCLVTGRIFEEFSPPPVKLINIYICAEFYDSQVERLALMEKVFPDLRLFCARNDYELNVVDLHWGVPGDCLDDHSFREICLNTLKDLRKRGNLIVLIFLNEQLECLDLPRNIASSDFEFITKNVTNSEDKELLYKWYLINENMIPPCYVLQPISDYLPGIIGDCHNKRQEAMDQWRKESKEMIKVLKSVMTDEQKMKYMQSGCKWSTMAVECLIAIWLDMADLFEIPLGTKGKLWSKVGKKDKRFPKNGECDLMEFLMLGFALQENVFFLDINVSTSGIGAVLEQLHFSADEVEDVENIYLTLYDEPVLEEEIYTALHEEPVILQRCFWIHRKFIYQSNSEPLLITSPVPLQRKEISLIDSTDDDDRHFSRVKMWLENSLHISQRLICSVQWNERLVKPEESSEYAKYVNNVCQKVKQTVQDVINKIIKRDLEEGFCEYYRGIENSLYAELCEQTISCRFHQQSVSGCQAYLNVIHEYLTSNSCHPLIIYGESGCGKTSLVAKTVAFCPVWVPDLSVVFRIVGVSPDSRTVERLLISICRQCCILYDEPTFLAMKSLHKAKAFQNFLLTRAHSTRPLLIIIDGIDQVSSYSSRDICWIPLELPQHVKMILSFQSGSEEFEKFKKIFRCEESYLEISNLTPDECLAIIDNVLKKNKQKLTEVQHSLVWLCCQNSPSLCYVQLLAYMSLYWHSIKGPSELEVKRTAEGLIFQLLTILGGHVGDGVVTFILGLLVINKQGISDAEILDILSCEDLVLQRVYSHECSYVRRFPCLLWAYIKCHLSVLLKYTVTDGRSLLTWRNENFHSFCERYLHKKNCNLPTLALVDYFEGWWAGNKEKPYLSPKEGTEILKNRYVLVQPLYFGSFPNRRKFIELPYYYLRSLGNSHFKEKFILNPEWLQQKIEAVGPLEVLEDMKMYQCMAGEDEEISLLIQILQLSNYALLYDRQQIFTQLYTRLFTLFSNNNANNKEFPFLKLMFERARWAPSPSLLPVIPCRQTPKTSCITDPSLKVQMTHVSNLYRLKQNWAHMISLSKNHNEIILWNIYNQEVAKILYSASRPKELKMIDDHRALVLCDCTLSIYNIDEGLCDTKFKVSGYNSCYFGYYGNCIVIFSEKNMCISFLNIKTGEEEDTLKLDDYGNWVMNKLVVTSNGQLCVWRTSIQNQSSILVWELKNKKLLYDLHISTYVFIPQLSEETDDGYLLVSACQALYKDGSQILILYDLQTGDIKNQWNVCTEVTAVAVYSELNCVLSGLSNTLVVVWEITTTQKRFILRGHSAPVDHIQLSVSSGSCVTWDSKGYDCSLRLWDLKKGECLSTFTPDELIVCCELSLDGKAVVIGLEGKPGITTLILCHNSTVQNEQASRLGVWKPRTR
ncbi:NACHT domain- and WD repeat-containing protein 1-like [Tachypleus tridentatus]|uniref:NACHT domain- and WD repeat-containing protein 1-like n=1 Tax=Tachypleus tridentatus TaxID=6853 RepID=UPI003FD536F8